MEASYQEQQYTDYSCRTPIERLARDIEIVLRREWHLYMSDRHVSSERKDAAFLPA